MRLLQFNVVGQRISRSPTCDFTGIVKGTRGYLFAQFSFDNDWKNCGKIVVFNDTHPVKLDKDGTCEIPAEVLNRESFMLRMIGVKPGLRITTNNITIPQVG